MRTKLSTARLSGVQCPRPVRFACRDFPWMCRVAGWVRTGVRLKDVRVQAPSSTNAPRRNTHPGGPTDRSANTVVDSRRTAARPTPCPSRSRGRGTVGRIPRAPGGQELTPTSTCPPGYHSALGDAGARAEVLT
jgi:hypothetical protein